MVSHLFKITIKRKKIIIKIENNDEFIHKISFFLKSRAAEKIELKKLRFDILEIHQITVTKLIYNKVLFQNFTYYWLLILPFFNIQYSNRNSKFATFFKFF